MTPIALDLFSGPRGWSEGLKLLGHTDHGIELDEDANATARAAGHLVEQLDIAATAIEPYRDRFAGLIASPPCPAFSQAGKGAGRVLINRIVAAVHAEQWDALADEGPEVALTLDVGRWLDLDPRWITFEQVPAVLPIWRAFGHVLERRGYSVWTGILSAERYGVPQTRTRAVLMASRDHVAHPPAPTHQAYEPGIAQGDPEACGGLFDHVEPWISIHDAVGPIGEVVRTGQRTERAGGLDLYERSTEAPSPTLTGQTRSWQLGFPRRADTDDAIEIDGEAYRARDLRPVEAPATTLTEKARSWIYVRPATTVLGDPRLWPPGHKVNADDRRRIVDADERYGGRAGSDAIRLTLAQALVLQSFRADYPIHGNRTSAFGQVGNAVPPLLARAILAEVLKS